MTKTAKNSWSDSPLITHSGTDSVRRADQRQWLRGLCVIVSLLSASTAFASSTVTGLVPINGRYLVTGSPVTALSPALLKLTFENNTGGTNLELCAGTVTDFNAGSCPMLLSDSGGPGFRFLTLVDVTRLSGKIIYVLRAVGLTPSQFTLTVE